MDTGKGHWRGCAGRGFPLSAEIRTKRDGPAHEPPYAQMMNQQHPGGNILHPAGENDKTKGRDTK